MKLLPLVLSLFLCLPAFANKPVREIVLSKDNTAVLSDVVDGGSVAATLAKLKELDASNKSGYPIYLFLNTPGGSIQAGLELIEGVKGINRPVDTVTLFAASMGWQTVQNLNKRYILAHGVLMSHKAKGGFEGEFGDGMSQIDSRYALWMQRILDLDMQTVRRTEGKQTLKTYRSQYENEMWLTGAQAVSRGYADEVVTVRCSSDLSGTRDEHLNFMGIDILLVFSECPIITYPLKIEAVVPSNKGSMKLSDFLAKGGVFLHYNKDGEQTGEYYNRPELYCTDSTLNLQTIRKAQEEARTSAKNEVDNKKVIRGY